VASNIRELVESPLEQGEDEIIVYTVDMSAVGTPSSPVVVVKDVNAGTAVTGTVMPVNSPTVAGSVITLSPLKLLTRNVLYRVEVKSTISNNVLEHYFYVYGRE
jgi:hypothetical protein